MIYYTEQSQIINTKLLFKNTACKTFHIKMSQTCKIVISFVVSRAYIIPDLQTAQDSALMLARANEQIKMLSVTLSENKLVSLQQSLSS